MPGRAGPLDGAAEVWWARREDAAAGLTGLLDDGERQRWKRYRLAGDRDRFLAGCALTKVVVARHTGQRPADVRLDRTCGRCAAPHGRPVVNGCDLAVSVTHSGDLIAVAVASGMPVGVDVERSRARPWLAGDTGGFERAARFVLSDGERAELAACDDPARAVLVAWTRKEAVTKATGDGLGVPFSRVVVSAAGGRPRVIAWPYPDSPAGVRLFDVGAAPGYAACVAVIGDCERVRVHDGAPLLRRAVRTGAQ
ncbi:MAG TPA: 4'-phosphopantetheinyl transferase superfamily protein [Streptosporangiaceae bacterium]|nr:4'-phosphopantetheinyl transferase superfamily protein [Streptosporangiaceae bacterium]